MSEILHLIGLCPDSLSHVDILDIVSTNWNQLQIIGFYAKKCLGL